jgi:hypothetical protein
MAKVRRDHGAAAALLAVAALAGVGMAHRARRGRGSRSGLREIKWDPRMCVITAEMIFEQDNAMEDRDQALGEGFSLDEERHGMFLPGVVEYVAFGKKKITMAPFRGDVDQEKLFDLYLAAAKKLRQDLSVSHLSTGSMDNHNNLEVLIYDLDAPRIIKKVSELDLARHERMDAEDFELEPTPYFRVRDWRFYPQGFTNVDHIPLYKIEVSGEDLYMKEEED